MAKILKIGDTISVFGTNLVVFDIDEFEGTVDLSDSNDSGLGGQYELSAIYHELDKQESKKSPWEVKMPSSVPKDYVNGLGSGLGSGLNYEVEKVSTLDHVVQSVEQAIKKVQNSMETNIDNRVSDRLESERLRQLKEDLEAANLNNKYLQNVNAKLTQDNLKLDKTLDKTLEQMSQLKEVPVTQKKPVLVSEQESLDSLERLCLGL